MPNYQGHFMPRPDENHYMPEAFANSITWALATSMPTKIPSGSMNSSCELLARPCEMRALMAQATVRALLTGWVRRPSLFIASVCRSENPDSIRDISCERRSELLASSSSCTRRRAGETRASRFPYCWRDSRTARRLTTASPQRTSRMRRTGLRASRRATGFTRGSTSIYRQLSRTRSGSAKEGLSGVP